MSKVNKEIPIVWSIAGSDCSAGAGIQADIASFNDFDVHGCTIITSVTAQNTISFNMAEAVSVDLLNEQITSVLEQGIPKAIKLGMMGNKDNIKCVGKYLRLIKNKFPEVYIICDPVLMSSSGGRLLHTEHIEDLIKYIFPITDLLTPNTLELESLTETTLDSQINKESAARICHKYGVKSVLLKGGHDKREGDQIVDSFYSVDDRITITALDRFNLHNKKLAVQARGTGCRLSSAIAALIAQGCTLEDSLVLSNAYVHDLLERSYKFGFGASQLPTQFELRLSSYPNVTARDETQHTFPQLEHLDQLYPVVDDVSWIEKLIPLGVVTIQLRLKEQPRELIVSQIQQAVMLQKKHNLQLFINDYWDLAIEYNAYGIHLGQSDLLGADLARIEASGLHLGVSTHSWWEISRALSVSPSYIAIGPIFETQTKEMPFESQGVDQLQKWVKLLQSRYPIVAIGGINEHTIDSVLETGVNTIALVSAITHADDYQKATKQLYAKISAYE
jgi:hydroxymethylpyrimidine kinase / phosphomethylpyrimidine kinase / thiamine-phosphate diphosphorylase